jgi:hypothetical protein
VVTTIVSHTCISIWEIGEMTLPQIETIMKKLGKHIGLKLGISVEESFAKPEEEHTVEQGFEFAALFAGL